MATAVTRLTMSEPSTEPTANQPITITSWSRTIIQPILLVANTLALIAVILIFLQRVDSERPWINLLIPCLVIAVESYSTTIWLTGPTRRLLSHTKYRAAEMLVLLLLLRIVTWALYGNWPDPTRWPEYLINPFILFIDPFFIGALVVAYAAWYRTSAISGIFSRLAPDRAEQEYYAIPRPDRIEANQPLPTDREALQRSFVQQFLGGAILLLVCISIISIDLEKIWTVDNPLTSGISRLQLPQGMLAALLIYFLTGFLLFSQGRLAMLEARWLADDVIRSPGIGRSWYRRTVLILVALGLLAAFLPLGSTFALGHLLGLALYGITLTISALCYFFSVLILSLLAFLFPQQQTTEPEPFTPPRPFTFPPQQPEMVEPDMTMQMIITSAFWAIAIVMSIVALSFFLRERNLRFNAAVLRQIWQAFLAWCRMMWQGIRTQIAEVQETIQTRLQRPSPAKELHLPWRYVRLNALSPRDKVRYFYLSVVKRAGNEGVPRRQSETPSEFAGDLKTNWPDTGPEIDELTKAFLYARYSPKPVEEQEIPLIKAQWERVKASIRRRRQGPGLPADDEPTEPNGPQSPSESPK